MKRVFGLETEYGITVDDMADLDVVRIGAPLDAEAYARLAEHGERVRRHAGRFP